MAQIPKTFHIKDEFSSHVFMHMSYILARADIHAVVKK